MARKKKHPEHVNHERWLVSYADFITLLFAFFVVMFAVSQTDAKKVGRFQESFSLAVGMTQGEHGYLPREPDGKPPIQASMQPLPPEIARNDMPPEFPSVLSKVEKDLTQKMAVDPMLAKLKVVRRGNELVLRMDATALFDSGDDKVKEAAMATLVAIANEVRERPVQIRVEGHTDNQPIKTLRFRSNWDLSTARATSVVAVLADPGPKGGHIDPHRIMASGYAEFQPVGSNDTSEGRAMNRRVDFVLSVTIVQLPWSEAELPDAESDALPPPPPPPAPEPVAVPAAAPAAAGHGEGDESHGEGEEKAEGHGESESHGEGEEKAEGHGESESHGEH
ncbi:MAG: flagellar motor protein MotB [Myxococcota bacterium]